ncbi:MAG: PIN domain-containing protein [Candidatus Bipolaricaulota bacterium]|nr:PIN domain-containing protein [Candidatus Bipolaricaulota bacterium]MDW8140786.1 PIN domain-containing protein [Candidatus Bipolaricaulota bacterium]
MMALQRYVTDTHTLFWYLTASPKLSPTALRAFREAEQGYATIIVPTLVLAELYFLNEKLQQPLDFALEYQKMAQSGLFEFATLDAALVLLLPKLSTIPEMHDRLIAAVAYREQVPLLTRDDSIRQSGLVAVCW